MPSQCMTLLKRLLRIVVLVELLLLIGFLPTLFNPNARIYGGPGGGWDWSPWGFVGPLAGLMLIAGLAMDYAWRNIRHPVLRRVAVAAPALAVGLLWIRIVRSE